MTDIAVQLENVSKYYKLYNTPKDRLKEALHPFGKKLHRDFYALKNINLEVKRGEILGIVGRNGSGKSTLLQVIAGILQPNSGNRRVNGEISTLLDLGLGMNPDFNGIQNIYFGGIMMGHTRQTMDEKLNEIIAFADIGEFINQPLKTYSSGMKARLGFALAVSVKPEILVIDEVLAVGDELFKRKCYAKMEELFNSGCTVFFVSQTPNLIAEICTKAIIMDAGEIILEGSPKSAAINYEKLLFEEPQKVAAFRTELRTMYEKKKLEPVIPEKPQEPVIASSLLDDNEPTNPPKMILANSCTHESVYLPEFQSSAKMIHRTANIDLLDPHITTLQGQRVNYLFPNYYYYMNHGIYFAEDAENIAVACVFKSEKGLVLAGIRHPGPNKSINYVDKNSTYLVKWKFKCGFLPGIFYLDIGVVGFKGGQKHVLSAEYDTLVFKVQSCKCLKDRISSWSYFSVEPDIEMMLEKK